MQFASNKNIVLLSLSGGALALLAGYYSSSQPLILLSAILFFLSMGIWKFGYLAAPLLTQAFGISLQGGDFELPPKQDCILRRLEGGYLAISFLSISLRDSSQFKSEGQKAALMEMFERSLSSLKFMAKISLIICPLDLSGYMQKLEEARSLAEQRKSQTKNSANVQQLEREISGYSSQIERLSSGDSPMQVLAFAQTAARGLTKEEALSRCRTQAREAQSALCASLASEVEILCGEDLLQCMEWETSPPASRGQISSSLF